MRTVVILLVALLTVGLATADARAQDPSADAESKVFPSSEQWS